MPDGTLRLILGGLLFLHGLAHGGAMGSLWWIATRPGVDTGGWTAARLWAAPGIATNVATATAIGFWSAAVVAFVVAALGFWGVVVPADWWRPAAVGGAMVSLVGIVLFAGTWPLFNTVAAVIVNVAVLVAVLVLHWGAEPVGT